MREEWEVWVIDDPRNANAFILPGGKVFVYSGILQVARTQASLAAVLSHEVAHSLAQHHAERMSAALGTNMILYSLIFLTAPLPGAFFIIQALGGQLLDTLFTRPMSRKMESEADYIGLMLMAEACYDPREALQFWERMEHISRSAGSLVAPEWMSTHPSNQKRIEMIEGWMPQAMKKWQSNECDQVFKL